MPELPEVETIARGLAKRITGEVIESVWLGQKKEPLKSPASAIAATLEHARIRAVRRMGKHIVFDLEKDQDHVARAPSRAKKPKNGSKAEGRRLDQGFINRASRAGRSRPSQTHQGSMDRPPRHDGTPSSL